MAERDFDEFYASNYGRLVVQMFAVTGNRADAEDAVQEALIRWYALGAMRSTAESVVMPSVAKNRSF